MVVETPSNGGVSARKIVISNIVALVGAILSLIWNTAVTMTEFKQVKGELDRVQAVQSAVIQDQVKQGEKLDQEAAARQLLDGRIYRLEDLQLRRR